MQANVVNNNAMDDMYVAFTMVQQIMTGHSHTRVVTRVEAGSNTSIVTLRVVGGDEKKVSNLKQ
jgi:hypothetical protein